MRGRFGFCSSTHSRPLLTWKSKVLEGLPIKGAANETALEVKCHQGFLLLLLLGGGVGHFWNTCKRARTHTHTLTSLDAASFIDAFVSLLLFVCVHMRVRFCACGFDSTLCFFIMKCYHQSPSHSLSSLPSFLSHKHAHARTHSKE